MIAVLTGFVIVGRGTYLQALLRRIDAALGTSIATGVVARFASALGAPARGPDRSRFAAAVRTPP